MGKLYVYAIFHGNLSFSYIPADLYPQILRRCYWPLLRIIEEQGVPFGLEFSAHTLQILTRLDPGFVTRLRELWHAGMCEFVGSGYVQSIMPLIPSEVNRENLRLGNAVYEELLGRRPSVAYVNEQVFSAGLPRLYQEAGYESLIVNWESALPAHGDRELGYKPCTVTSGEGRRIPIIWHSLAAYRDFQQYVENEISLDSYLARLASHIPETGYRTLPLYSSDWEVFDFKPWRVYPEGFVQPDLGEMDRIAGLLALLKGREDIQFVTPSSLLAHFPEPPLVHPESSAHPLPYKKQFDHSVTRWAVGGRDNVRLNTQCFRLQQKLVLADWYLHKETAAASLLHERDALWQEICFLWSSDFRTFTTEEKYLDFRNRMGAALDRVDRLNEAIRPQQLAPGELWLANCSPVPAESEPITFTITANGTGSEDQQGYGLHLDGATSPCQVTQRVVVGDGGSRLTLEALPELGVGQAGTGTVRPEFPSPTGRAYQVDARLHIVETDSVRVRLLPQQGGCLESLEFPGVSPDPLICVPRSGASEAANTIDHPLPGDLAVEDSLGRIVSDHQHTELQYPESGERHEIFIPVRCSVETDLGTIWKTYRVYLHQPRLDLIVRFQWRDVVPNSFRLGRMIFNPRAFDPDTLYYATTNGGTDIERFELKGNRIQQDQPLNGVTAQGCLGATEGWVVVGDAYRGLGFVSRHAELYSVPMLRYEEPDQDPEAFRLSLVHSLGEGDETSHTLWRGHSTWSLSVLGGRDDVVTKTRASALLSNGGLVARSY